MTLTLTRFHPKVDGLSIIGRHTFGENLDAIEEKLGPAEFPPFDIFGVHDLNLGPRITKRGRFRLGQQLNVL